LFSRVLVAYDGSGYSEKALDYACRLAVYFKASIRIVSVIDTERVKFIVYDVLISREEEFREKVKRMLDKTVKKYIEKYSGLRIDYRIRTGHPAEEILKEAREWNAELLVIGAKGTTDLREIAIGGIAETLIKYSEIPVLIIK